MKTLTYLAPCAFFLCAGLGHAQGPLTPPPGAPAPGMKTLAQIEPRIDVTSLSQAPPYTITAPGSYYLSKNITVTDGDAIVIAASNVSLDLGGFVLTSSKGGTGSGSAIVTSGGYSRLSICHGSIDAAPGLTVGFSRGIFVGGTSPELVVTDIHVMGVANDGINLGTQGIVQRCTTLNCGATGIFAGQISDCTAINAQGCGILGLVVTGSLGTTSATSVLDGIAATVVTNSIGISTLGTGLSAETASHSTGKSTSGVGVYSVIADHCTGTTAGTSSSAVGLFSSGTADACRGNAGGGASKALSASVAIGCTYSGGGLDVPFAKQFNM